VIENVCELEEHEETPQDIPGATGKVISEPRIEFISEVRNLGIVYD
jgi:hypothetical protein